MNILALDDDDFLALVDRKLEPKRRKCLLCWHDISDRAGQAVYCVACSADIHADRMKTWREKQKVVQDA
jgi:hypothetical protein